MGKIGNMLAEGGKGLLKGMEEYSVDGSGGIPGSGMSMAGGPMSGVNLMNHLFKQLGIFGRDKEEDEGRQNPPSGIVGPRN